MNVPKLGVCSWSLQPGSPQELAQLASATGVKRVQLALDPLRTGAWGIDTTRVALAEAGLELVSGMLATPFEDYSSMDAIERTGGFRPDVHWEENLAIARDDARIAGELGLELVTFHAGFLPEDVAHPERGKMLERLRTVADVFAAAGVRLAFETGQETAATLTRFLDDLERPAVGINFDPANMILYDKGDPIAALESLLPRVHQCHVKDARRAAVPGTWGSEVPAGEGEVDWPGFVELVREKSPCPGLVIEREAGEARVADVRTANELITRLWETT